MPYSAMKIANFFIELAHKKQREITPLKLQKLLYFAHGWHLVLDDEGEALLDEKIEAWRYGPVVPSVYYEFKEFRDEHITRPGYLKKFDVVSPELSTEELKILGLFLNKIWEVYAHRPAMFLSNLTHLRGTPWRKIYDEYDKDIPLGKRINNKDIRLHFQDKLKRSKENK